MNREVFEDFISEISHLYNYDTYDLLRNNCNNFTQRCSMFLTGNSIPDWIANLPNEVLATPFGRMIEPMITQWTNRMKQQSMLSHGFDPSNFPATQAALNQQIFQNQPSVANQPNHSNQPNRQNQPSSSSTTTPSTHKTEVTISSTPSAHSLRKPLFADQRPTSFSPVLKQLALGSQSDHIIQNIENFFNSAESSSSLPPDVLETIISYANTCPLASGFAPLFILRLLVLNESINTALSSNSNLLSLLDRFIRSDESPVAAKAMALVLAANLFAHKPGQTLLLDSPHTTEWLGELLSPVEQRRTPAAGLLYNYALCLSNLSNEAIGQHEEKFWQTVTLLAEILVESKPVAAHTLTASEEEFYWRVCSALFFLVSADSSAKDIANQLDIVESLKPLQHAANGTKLPPLLKDIFSSLSSQ